MSEVKDSIINQIAKVLLLRDVDWSMGGQSVGLRSIGGRTVMGRRSPQRRPCVQVSKSGTWIFQLLKRSRLQLSAGENLGTSNLIGAGRISKIRN